MGMAPVTPERRQGFIRQRQDLLIMGALLLAFMAFSVFKFSAQASDISDQQEALKTGLIEACEHSPIKEAVIGQIQYQLDQSRTVDYETLFPDIPPDQLHTLIHQANEQRRAQLEQINSVDCQARYQ